MKTLFIFASVMAVLFIAAPKKVEAQKGKTAKLPKELVLQMARDDDDIKSGLRKQGGNTVRFAAKNFVAELIDLNKDGKPEWFISGSSSDFCGNRVCSSWIYREVSGKYELLLADSAIPLNTFTNGYKDLEVGFGPYVPTIYTYNGRRYKEGYDFTLNQIIMPSKLGEIKKLVCDDAKKRLVRVKNIVKKDMDNETGGWIGSRNLWYEEYEDGWKEKMKKEYSEIQMEKFKVTTKGISFYYDTTIGLPMSVLSEEPSSEYFYSWAILKPFLMPSSPISTLIK
ncbi:MAG: hypothetical protein WA584_16710 [Pyrinomonadaceae bacterium]